MLGSEKLTDTALAYRGLNYKSLNDTVLATIINKRVLDIENISKEGQRTAPRASLYRALSVRGRRNFILECKKSSPTLGDFCQDFNLDRILDCYEKHASAISVLCEPHFFKGSLDYLSYVKSRTRLPVICKDFIISEEQLTAANNAGADAVLLMLSVLSRDFFLELAKKAHDLGLEVLCEVDTYEDAMFAIDHNLKIVGINNRDLRTLKVDLGNAKKLYSLFDAATRVISESGIHEHQQLVDLKPIRNFLIGSSLTGADNIEFKASSMLYGMNKICGLKTLEALDAAIAGHASIAGLIFYQKSPRAVTLDEARALTDHGRGRISFAGVFVDEDPEVIINTARALKLDFVQLHGSESVQMIEQLKKELPDTRIIKAVKVKDPQSFAEASDYAQYCDFLLLDSPSPGSGAKFDWRHIPDFIDRNRTLLAGGIGPDNLDDALEQRFLGLDLNSKLEKTKGVKDPAMIKEALDRLNRF